MNFAKVTIMEGLPVLLEAIPSDGSCFVDFSADCSGSVCGSNLYPLGFPDEKPHVCALPDAQAVPTETQVMHHVNGE